MERRRTQLIQELNEAREELLNINFATGTTKNTNVARTNGRNVSRPYALVDEWRLKWTPTFRKLFAFTNNNVYIHGSIVNKMDGYELETDTEIFNEMRPALVGLIDYALSKLDEYYQVKPVLDDYIKRVAGTKLAVLLNEFNAVKDIAPNHAAIGFRTILSLVIQEKAKREKPGSNTASRPDLSVDKMIDCARTDSILSSDEQRLVDSFKSTHKDIYDFVAHRPGAKNLADKSEVDTMVDLLNKLLPAIIN